MLRGFKVEGIEANVQSVLNGRESCHITSHDHADEGDDDDDDDHDDEDEDEEEDKDEDGDDADADAPDDDDDGEEEDDDDVNNTSGQKENKINTVAIYMHALIWT